eukprot:Selendium_serpulae@DN4472_c0_g1_i6.p1
MLSAQHEQAVHKRHVKGEEAKHVDTAPADAALEPTTVSPAPVWLRMLATAYVSVAMMFSLIVGFVAMCGYWILFWPVLISRDRDLDNGCDKSFRAVCSFFAFTINPFWKLVETRPLPKRTDSKGAILMINHLSAADPWALNSTVWYRMQVKYVFKGSMMKIPVIGWCLRMTQDLPIYFTKEKGGWGTEKNSVNDLFTRAAKLLNDGTGVVVFPEGTRSKSGRLQPFKDGFFKFAVENDFPILPIGLHNTPGIWPLKGRLLNSGTAYVGFGDYVYPKGKTVEQVKADVQAEFMKVLDLAPSFNAKTDGPTTEAAATRGQGL